MNRNWTNLALLIFLTLLFEFLFWGERLGLNLVLYVVLIGTVLLLRNRDSLRSVFVRVTALGTLVAAALLLVHGSGAARFALIASALACFGFVLMPSLRTLPGALGTMFLNIGTGLTGLKSSGRFWKKQKTSPFAYLSMSVIPLIFALSFFLLFVGANPKFRTVTGDFFTALGDFVFRIFGEISLPHILFLCFGFLLATGFVFHIRQRFFSDWEGSAEETLERVRVRAMNQGHSHPVSRILGLQNEYRSGLMLVITVNLLALLNNVLDISWVWFGFEVPENFDLRQFVHEGTWLLILSILLSMVIMFYFFRGNLNFYKRSRALRIVCYIWIVQNVIMVISVFLRNYHYIDYHGLAYKRIGVIFFLAMTLVGLLTLWYKIRHRHTFFRVLRINAWAAYAVMLMIAAVNWDMVIARHNLAHMHDKEVDVPFLLELSDKTLPLLDQHRKSFDFHDPSYGNLKYRLDHRIAEFRNSQKDRSWLSWTLAEERAIAYFNHRNQKGALKP